MDNIYLKRKKSIIYIISEALEGSKFWLKATMLKQRTLYSLSLILRPCSFPLPPSLLCNVEPITTLLASYSAGRQCKERNGSNEVKVMHTHRFCARNGNRNI